MLGNVGDVFGSQTIEQFQFTDGTTLTYADLIVRGFDLLGTTNNDVLFGTNLTNRFIGGVGNDTLFGGTSEDTYFFNVGDGIDLIVDASTPEGRNTVVFGPGIPSTQLTLSVASDPDTGQEATVLVVRPGNGDDAIQFKNFDRTDVFGPHAVDSFQFADGSSLSYSQLLSRGFDLVWTAGNDIILGTNITDRITSGAGDDQVQSGAGDDVLDGGAGNDQLNGGSGNDTYLFGPGSGHDRILDEQGTADVVRLAPGIVASDVAVTRSGDDLVLSLNGGADQLTIAHHFLLPTFRIEAIQFSDGSALTSAFLDSPVILGTQQSDVLVGTGGDDVLAGLGGNDQLSGLAGNDQLDGGTGDDTLTGGPGDD
ncbi:MAG: calcium-binding protein, partial [bacterium]